MELHLLVPRADQVIDDMGGRGIATSTAEPFAAGQASHDRAWIVNATVTEA